MDWLTQIKNAEKTCMIQDGKRKIHFKFQDGKEMAEEYSLQTGILLRRAWKNGGSLSKKAHWEIEVGDPEPDPAIVDNIGIKENPNSPYIIKRITKSALEWRIRNLSYPIDTYSVTAEPDNKCITVRTTNKKYFKKIFVPELERANLLPEQNHINYSYAYGTLIISVSCLIGPCNDLSGCVFGFISMNCSLSDTNTYHLHYKDLKKEINGFRNVGQILFFFLYTTEPRLPSTLYSFLREYKKPREVLQMEKAVSEEIKDVKPIQDGDLPCKPS